MKHDFIKFLAETAALSKIFRVQNKFIVLSFSLKRWPLNNFSFVHNGSTVVKFLAETPSNFEIYALSLSIKDITRLLF